MRVAVIALSVAIVSAAHAGAIVKISSNEAARVAVDGEDLGVTPITLRDMKPGTYEIKLENVRTGLVQTYSIKSPKSGTVEREITAKWADAAGQVAPAPAQLEPSAQAGVAVHAPIAAPAAVIDVTHASPAVAVLAADAPPVEKTDEAKAKERLKVKARNVALGAALANEVFNKGSSKKTVRKAAVGLGLLNEALNR